MTSGEVLGVGDDHRPNRTLPALVVAALVVTGVAVALSRGGSHRGAAPPSPAPTPASSPPGSLAIVPEAALLPPSLGHVGDLAVSLARSSRSPIDGTVTTLDGPPATSPQTFTIRGRVPVAVTGSGSTAWIAEVTSDPAASAGPGILEALDVTTGRTLATVPLPGIPHSVVLAAGQVVVGLDDQVFAWDPVAKRAVLHPTPPGAVVDLVRDPSGRDLYAAVADDRGSRLVRWALPSITKLGDRAAPSGLRLTHLAFGFGSLWASSVSTDSPHGLIERLDPATLSTQEAGPLDSEAAVQSIYSGLHEMWVLDARSRTLRCVRPSSAGVRVGATVTLPPLEPATEATRLLVAVGDRVYVDIDHGPATYERSVSCPGT